MSTQEFLEAPPFPRFVQFETGTACNADCLMCPHSRMKRKGTAKWSLLSKIIREAVPNVDAVCPFLMQEPFLDSRLVSVLANVKQNNLQCQTIVYTNMSYIPEKAMDQILKVDLLDELHISFYGPTEELYKKWQPPLKREDTIRNIKQFFLMRQQLKRSKPRISLHVLGVPEIIQASREGGYGDLVQYVDEVAAVQYDTFHGDMPDYGGDQTVVMGKPAAPRVPCQRLWTGMNIHFNGNVVPCCIDYDDANVLGNASKDSLQDIWQNLDFEQFRRLHMDGRWNEIAMCRECRVHEYQFGKEWTKYWLNKNK